MKNRMKISKNYYFFKRLKQKHIPLHVQIELTTKCNSRCIHCIREKRMKGELTLSEMKKVILQLKSTGCLQLTFTGGEPLLRKDFFDVSAFAASEGFVLNLFSNATLINGPIARELKKMKFKKVKTTLFSAEEKVHDSITRNPGSFKKTLKAIGILKKNNISVHISTVIMKNNINGLEKLKDMAKKKNWRLDFEPIIYPTYTNLKYPLSNRITDKSIESLKGKNLLDCTRYESIDSKMHELDFFYLGNLHCYISADGRVFPHATIRLELGDLKAESFRDIWENSPGLKRLRSLDFNSFECSDCSYFLNCRWGLGLSLSEQGRITAKPKEWCRIMNVLQKEVKI